ncbi:GerAB/ArcD/ProY family transporter [Paenibacillus phocaensis]|uniref:GerAB/ArcD/ProY family transporter n=1 Tax=Paenibacillus phocaensis TaxID=1776378 RepID=UPI000839B906|nr:endospore germination permease [Paenibacillus phocaensis]
MNKDLINAGEARTILILFIMGSTMILGAAGQAKSDAWLSIMFAILIAIPIVLIAARLLTLFPGQNLFEICQHVFGKWIGKAFSLLYIWYAIHVGALVLRHFGEFMDTETMPETPMIVPMLFVSALSIIVVLYGLDTMGRSARLLLNICMFTIVLVLCLTIQRLNFNHLLPILDNGWGPVWEGTFSAFSFPFAETFLLTAILGGGVNDRKSFYRIFLHGLWIGGLLVLFISYRNILVLGPNTISNVYFPSYTAVGRINIGDFIQRIEGTVAVVFVICVFMKLSVCLLAASQGIAKLLHLKSYRSVAVQTGLLITYLASALFNNIMEMDYFVMKIYQYYAFPFQVVFPLILLLAAEIKVRRERRATSG